MSLLKRHDVSSVYCEEILGTHTSTYANTKFHSFAAIMLVGHEDGTQLTNPKDRLEYELIRKGHDKTKVKSFVKAFSDEVPIRQFSGNHFLKGGIVKAAETDLLDKDYINKAIYSAVQSLPGGYTLDVGYKFEIIKSNMGFCVFSDIDFEKINTKRFGLNPPLEAITIAHILSNILDSRADIALASFYGSDFITSSTNSSIIQLRHSELLKRTKLNSESFEDFVEVTLPDTPSLAEVIDSREQSFTDYLILLDHAAKFKDWLSTVNPDEGLVKTYLRDVSSTGWLQRLPAKSVRYILCTAIAAKNPIAGVVSGLVDNFLLDKIGSGWQPNHFITKKLSPFVRR